MRVSRRVAAQAVFDQHALDGPAGNVRQLVLVDEGRLGVLRLWLICENAAERQGWRQAANRGCVSWRLSVGECAIRLLLASGGAIRPNRCGRGAPRPTAPTSAPLSGHRSIGPRGHSRPHAGRRSPSDRVRAGRMWITEGVGEKRPWWPVDRSRRQHLG